MRPRNSDWRVFEDPGHNRRFIETFLSESWVDHLRQRERVTKADHALEAAALRFQIGDGPEIAHRVAARPRGRHIYGHEAAQAKPRARKRRIDDGVRPVRDVDMPTTNADGSPPRSRPPARQKARSARRPHYG